jgi:hypothetical protein
MIGTLVPVTNLFAVMARDGAIGPDPCRGCERLLVGVLDAFADFSLCDLLSDMTGK